MVSASQNSVFTMISIDSLLIPRASLWYDAYVAVQTSPMTIIEVKAAAIGAVQLEGSVRDATLQRLAHMWVGFILPMTDVHCFGMSTFYLIYGTTSCLLYRRDRSITIGAFLFIGFGNTVCFDVVYGAALAVLLVQAIEAFQANLAATYV